MSEQHPIVSYMQRMYTNKVHNDIKKEAELKQPITELKLSEPQSVKNPLVIFNQDDIHALAGSPNMGAVGFETFGGGGYKSGRSLAFHNQLIVYDFEGHPYLSSAVSVYEAIDFEEPLAVLANSLFMIWDNFYLHESDTEWIQILDALYKEFDKKFEGEFNLDEYIEENKLDFEYESVGRLFQELTDASSYWACCDLMVEFITGEKKPRTGYTYNYENDLTQDLHYTAGSSDGFSADFIGVYFHTGGDARCGFTHPVFGVFKEDMGYIENYGVHFDGVAPIYFYSEELKEDVFSFFRDTINYEQRKILEKKYGRLPYEDESSYGAVEWMRDAGIMTIEPINQIGNSSWYADIECEITEFGWSVIRKLQHPSQDLRLMLAK